MHMGFIGERATMQAQTESVQLSHRTSQALFRLKGPEVRTRSLTDDENE